MLYEQKRVKEQLDTSNLSLDEMNKEVPADPDKPTDMGVDANGHEVSMRQAEYSNKGQAGNQDAMIQKAMDGDDGEPEEKKPASLESGDFVEKTCYVFGTDSGFRAVCLKISDSKPLEFFIFFCVAISSAALAIDSPWQPDKKMSHYLAILDPIMLGIFTAEFLLRVIAVGFYGTRTAYISDPFNRLDFFVICISYTTLVLSALPGGIGRVLRVLR